LLGAKHAAYHPERRGVRVLVGFDLVQISQVQDSILRFGDRYLTRVYTDRELLQVGSTPPQMATRLASSFAAKEATLKVLRPDARWLDWRSIEVVRTSGGWAEVVLHGAAAALAKRRRVGRLAVTMSHEADYAGAVVIGMGRGARPGARRKRGRRDG
jgi:holo-[acyl-carrier protein] synthase